MEVIKLDRNVKVFYITAKSFPDSIMDVRHPNGYCVEWYLNEKNVKCMIRLKD